MRDPINQTQSIASHRQHLKAYLCPQAARRSIRSLYFFQFVKEQLTQLKE